MPNYSNGKIYQIWSPFRPDLLPYVGSTTQTLARRIAGHRSVSRTKNTTSKIHFEQPGARIELICEFSCANRMELEREEGRHIRALECCNKLNAGVTPEERNARRAEYRQANREEIRANAAEYRQANKEAVRAYKAEYRQANKEAIRARNAQKIQCECGATLSRSCIARHRRSARHAHALEARAQSVAAQPQPTAH